VHRITDANVHATVRYTAQSQFAHLSSHTTRSRDRSDPRAVPRPHPQRELISRHPLALPRATKRTNATPADINDAQPQQPGTRAPDAYMQSHSIRGTHTHTHTHEHTRRRIQDLQSIRQRTQESHQGSANVSARHLSPGRVPAHTRRVPPSTLSIADPLHRHAAVGVRTAGRVLSIAAC